jgi:hypothetical protein
VSSADGILAEPVDASFSWDKLGLSFGHPFGRYGGQSQPEILDQKDSEIRNVGFTLWTFGVRRHVPDLWVENLLHVQGPIYVLLFDSPGAQEPDPHRIEPRAERFQPVKSNDWLPIPDGIWEAARHGITAAFIVKRVIRIIPLVRPPIALEYLRTSDGLWCDRPIPPRLAYMLRRGGQQQPRRVYAVLELQAPYLARLLPIGTEAPPI